MADICLMSGEDFRDLIRQIDQLTAERDELLAFAKDMSNLSIGQTPPSVLLKGIKEMGATAVAKPKTVVRY